MSIRFASAPCSWGVEDPNNPYIPSWENVLDEVAEAGYKGIELGPYGYFPLDPPLVSESLRKRGLNIIGGTLFDDFVSEKNLPQLIKKAEDICSLISQLPKEKLVNGGKFAPPYLVLIDIIKPERSPYAGNPDKAPRLDDTHWASLLTNIEFISTLAWTKYGVRAVLHPHAGGYIEFADEIDRFLDNSSYETTGLCLDAGHLYYSRMDPAQWLKDKYDRIDFIHFKDIDRAVYDRAITEEMDFFKACENKVMCPIGKGAVDYGAIIKTLSELGYNGWITLEQERDPREHHKTLNDIKESLTYLHEVGFN
ncbi:sugar phosphate isomerase/epimerase family protein [Vibrio viridaestus]|uniref:AP endonuclease n=1 Tax=Vibrio viridaestus TaxID=2487322 RepID=A0A3N9TL47_9VIBR|nr:sugar phosphate isomerase/epimerase [Vibrio viridaestus]RQW64841.1 AP endonuclease [Vibrio viridaestus]